MSCGTDTTMVELLAKAAAEQAIADALANGVLQGGLKTCGDARLAAASRVVQCAELDEAVTKAKLSAFTRVGSDLVLTDADGNQLTASLCGWQPKACEYYATVHIPIGGTCPFFRFAYAFHPEDLRDPAATVAVKDCDGMLLGWLYPTGETPHHIEITVDNAVVGYALASPVVRKYSADCCG